MKIFNNDIIYEFFVNFFNTVLSKRKIQNIKYIRNDGKVSCYSNGILTHTEDESIPRNGCYLIGNSICYYRNNELHRENDLPAIENINGTNEWYSNGKRHRENGPAYVRTEKPSVKAWFLYDIEYSEEEFNTYLITKKLKQTLGDHLKEQETHTKGKM